MSLLKQKCAGYKSVLGGVKFGMGVSFTPSVQHFAPAGQKA